MSTGETTNRPHNLLPYQELTDPSYAEIAARRFTVVHVSADTIVLRGSCPRCDAGLEVPLPGTIFRRQRSILGIGRRPTTPATGDAVEPMICTCIGEHPHRPEGLEGCGAYWTLQLTMGSPGA